MAGVCGGSGRDRRWDFPPAEASHALDEVFLRVTSKPFGFLFLLVACVALSMMLSAQAQTFRVLYSFNGPPDAQAPHSNLLLDGSGNIYGITFGGGSSYEGTVFKLSSSGKETVLYSFRSGYGNRPDSGNTRRRGYAVRHHELRWFLRRQARCSSSTKKEMKRSV